jgi:hypothetical protein
MSTRSRPARALLAATLTTAASLAATSPALAASAPPARGAPLQDVLWGSGVGAALSALVLWVAIAHRSRRISWLHRLGAFSARVSGLPAWAALPSAIAGNSLLIAAFGFYWDVAKHIDTGRDTGPFGTPAHYPILIGLGGVALGGFLSIVLGADRRVPTAVRITRDWHAPLGGLLIFLCGGFALAGFPLDDVWHTLFGQDVTLWGPTHVLMIAGASLATLGIWVLLVEGGRARAMTPAPHAGAGREPMWLRLRGASIAGGFLLGLSTLQGEFDFGVPQFQMVFQPILLMIAAGVGLVTARIRMGRFGALQAVAFFLIVRGLLTLIVGPVLGRSTLHFPLYVVEAGLVELVAWRIGRDRPLTLGAVSGALIGTVGLAAEWAWSHVWMPLPWPASLFPEGAILGFVAALAAGVLGGFVGRALASEDLDVAPAPRWLLPVAALAAVFVIAFPLPMTAGDGTRAASLTLSTLTPPPGRMAAATVRLDPPGAAKDAQWLTVTAWQGGGLVVDRLRKVGEGVYRTTQPIPVHGAWKAMLRMEHGRELTAVPISLPADAAIPVGAVRAPDGTVTRRFVRDKTLLQREAVTDAGWLSLPAYLVLLAIAASWLVALGVGLRRLERARFAAAGDAEAEPEPGPARPRGMSGKAISPA